MSVWPLCSKAWVSGSHSDYLHLVKNRFFVCCRLVHFMGACLIDFQGKMSGAHPSSGSLKSWGARCWVQTPHPAVRKLSSHCEEM